MAKADHIVLCGGVRAPRRCPPDQINRLDLGGDDPNVDLEIVDISRRLSSDVPEVLTDLIEIASYVYCADQAVSRGGEDILTFGSSWRRNFSFHIPVRLPAIWSSPEILGTLQRTLGILSEDTYEFHFSRRANAVPMQQYLKLDGSESAPCEIDEVLLFSGGVDSLGGAVQEAVAGKRRLALVSHRSTSKVFSRQKQLLQGLKALCRDNAPLHIPVWVHQSGTSGREYSQRSRTFLYASLAAAVAHVFGLSKIRFYENGVVGLNLPISEQVVGARATRTTHPQVLAGFARLFGQLVEKPFAVENPFLWVTKSEVVDLIGDAGCSHLVEQSISCMHTHEQTKEQPHCGRCSQCISRRFATLASRYPTSDPDAFYRAPLLTAERFKGEHPKSGDLTLVESFIRTATDIGSMSDAQILEHYGEISRVLRHVRPLSSDEVAEKVIHLYRRHSSDISKVMDGAIRDHASDIREGKLPRTCAVLLAIPEGYRKPIEGEHRDRTEIPAEEAGGAPHSAGKNAGGRNGKPKSPASQELRLPEWLTKAHPSSAGRQFPRPKGSMDLVEQSDPIWRTAVQQDGPIPITRLNGDVEWIASSTSPDPMNSGYKPDDERRIEEVATSGKSELRTEIEKVFSGREWPSAGALLEPLRCYALKVFDVNASAFLNNTAVKNGDERRILDAMFRNLLRGLFGSEWESSPGEIVTRTDWRQGAEGWEGREVVAVAGNDPDPNCLYHELVGEAIKYRYRFHDRLPDPGPDEPPGLNLTSEEWWRYIGLKERHNLAMAIRPYIEDRIVHWLNTHERPAVKSRKGDGTLLEGKSLVSFKTAEEYLGISERQRQNLMKKGSLQFEGGGHNQKITVASLKKYLPPEIPK